MDKFKDIIEVVGRVLLSALFIPAGYSKIGGYEGTQGYMEAMGVPGSLLPLVILAELGGGIALLIGFQARLAALGLAVFTIIASFLFHTAPDQMQQIMFMKNIAVSGGLLLIVAYGTGAFSVDKLISGRKAATA